MEKVAVVVLNYKLKSLTLDCIESVKRSTYKNILIVVVDNNSNDNLGETLKSQKDVLFIQNDQNLGYCGGNNMGIKQALTKDVDYVLILNPDTTIATTAIEELLKKAKENDAGIAGPKIYFNGSKKIWYAGGVFDQANVLGRHKGIDEEDKGQYDEVIETDFVTGAAIMVRRDVFEKVGLFDERYFLYLEDADLCFRAKKAGFKVIYVPSAIVYHRNAQSTGLGSPLQDYYITRNRMLFASKFLPFRTRFALFREALRNFGNSARRAAFIDYITGNLGKGSI